MKALVLNDVHLADRPPVSRADTYTDDLFAKLEECRDIAIAEKCALLIITGDLFHNKRPNFNSHKLLRRTIELLNEFPGRKLLVPGNHDLSESGLESIHKQPIGVLEAAGALEILLEDGITIDEDVSVQLSPAPYTDDIDNDPANYSLKRMPMTTYAVKIAHGMLVPDKDADHWRRRHVPCTTFSQVASRKIDLVLWGHPHYDYGSTMVRTTLFVSMGSLARVAATPQNRKRKMRVARIDFNKSGIIAVAHSLQSARPSSEVFLAGLESTVGDEVDLDEPLTAFARRLSKSLQSDSWTDIGEVLARFGKKRPKPVVELVKRYFMESGWD